LTPAPVVWEAARLLTKHPQRGPSPAKSEGREPVPAHLIRVRRVEEGGGASILHFQMDTKKYPTPPKQMLADYVMVRAAPDGVHLVFGKFDTFALQTAPTLHYALEILYPYSQFIAQMYQTIIDPHETGQTGERAFLASVEDSVKRGGYEAVDDIPPVTGTSKQGHVRANSSAMFIYDDEACVDFFHLDALSLNLASKGADTVPLGAVIRIIIAPNLLLYFLRRVCSVAQELMERNPSLAREAAHA
jgi:hypothetical protein